MNNRLVHSQREGGVTIVDEKAIRAIQRKAVAELLNGPLRRGMVGEIPMHDAACADVEDDKDVQPLKVAVTTMKKSQARTAPA